MAKLILTLDDNVLGEYPLDSARITVGRRPTNDIQIDNLAISGEHAVIVQIGHDFFIEDINSTNGTLLNDQPIKKHVLTHADVITLGKYQLKYINDAVLNSLGTPSEMTLEAPAMIRPSAMRATQSIDILPTNSAAHVIANRDNATPLSVNAVERLGKIQVLNGGNSGQVLVLNKALTTLGKPGVQVAVITKRQNAYYVTHVEGKNFPVVNGHSIGALACQLADQDVLELAGVKMAFYLDNSDKPENQS